MSTSTNYQTTQRTIVAPAGTSTNVEQSVLQDNSQPSNLYKNSKNKTTKFFNNYFTVPQSVSSNTNDAITSFFQTQTGDETAGNLLAQAVINTAKQQGEDPLVVLDQFRKMPIGELNVYLALYLNLSRVNSSLLGIKNVPQVNKYVQRSIIT